MDYRSIENLLRAYIGIDYTVTNTEVHQIQGLDANSWFLRVGVTQGPVTKALMEYTTKMVLVYTMMLESEPFAIKLVIYIDQPDYALMKAGLTYYIGRDKFIWDTEKVSF